jgi:putative two-component system response regulator
MSGSDKPVILCVDDATDLLALMGKALGDDYRVITANNAGDAITAAFGEPRPDLILLDIDMPDVNGLEVCQALKGEAQTAGIPVVFLTARNTMQQQVEGFETGAVDYITKPFNASTSRSPAVATSSSTWCRSAPSCWSARAPS